MRRPGAHRGCPAPCVGDPGATAASSHTRGPANCCLLKPPSSGEVCRAAEEAQTGFTRFPGIAENRPGLHTAGTFSVGIKNMTTFTATDPLKPPSLLSPEAAVPLHVGALSVFSCMSGCFKHSRMRTDMSPAHRSEERPPDRSSSHPHIQPVCFGFSLHSLSSSFFPFPQLPP